MPSRVIKRSTLRDVAEASGVSVATVSLILNGKGERMAARTRRLVLATAEELGYSGNAAARSLRSGHVRTIAIAASAEPIRPFLSTLLLNASQASRAEGYALMLLPEQDWRVHLEQALRSGQIDGAILHANLGLDEADVAGRRARVVVVDDSRSDPATSAPTVSLDARPALRQLVGHLFDIGHQRIAYLSPRFHTGARLDAFVTALEARGVEVKPGQVVMADPDLKGEIASSVQALLRSPSPPTAILCGNEVLAGGVYHVASRLGLRIPEDLSVAAVGLYGTAQSFYPPLTVLALPSAQMGTTAVELLLRALDSPDAPPGSVMLQASVVFGESTCPV